MDDDAGPATERHLERYMKQFPDVPGWFSHEAMVTWDFFLGTQESIGIGGDYLEVGVFKGRSAILGAMYLKSHEACVLIDHDPIPDATEMIERVRAQGNTCVQCPSKEAHDLGIIRAHYGLCRWIHVDGGHRGPDVASDLALAFKLLNDGGVICVDDFFNYRYPQLASEVYRFLHIHSDQLQMVFAGSNKCYICRRAMFHIYDGAIRAKFMTAIRSYALPLQLNRSSDGEDGGCFTVSWREGQREVVGLDGDPDTIPF